jgi:hypothetical protein
VSDVNKEVKMKDIERIELERHQHQIKSDVDDLVEKYRRIFDWDVPDNNESLADKLILTAIRQAIDDIEKN